MLSYPVIVEVKNLAGAVLEQRTVAAGSRIETVCGVHRIPAAAHDTTVANCLPSPDNIVFLCARPAEPWRVQAIPARLRQLIDGADPQWGREGKRWPRDCKTSGGGTAIDRAAGYAQMYHWLPTPPALPTGRPLALTPAEIERLRQALAPSPAIPAIPSPETGQLTLQFTGDL